MASGSPPALPVKQHRRSSADSDCVTLSPAGLQHQNNAFNEVFSEPTDCHAAQCPIHQRYDQSRHQMRFFSDGTPPPVPKKRLARTLSLPGSNAPSFSPLSPLSPQQTYPQNFANPLYMMGLMPDACLHEEVEESKPARGSPVPSLSFSQLSFDTPDEHLPYLFSSFVDQMVVSQGIQHRHLLFLRTMAQSVEARSLLQGESTEKDVGSYQAQDFLLCQGGKPKQIGDMIYYSVRSPKFPGRVLGLRIHKRAAETSPAPVEYQPPHVNVQNVIACFQPSSILGNNAPTASSTSQSDCSPAEPPGGSSAECATDPASTSVPTVQSFLQRGHAVSIERDLPHATLEDFVRESRPLQSAERLDYDRQVCFVLLQILMGSQHLYKNRVSAAELRPQDILLVWPSRETETGEDTMKRAEPRSSKTGTQKEEMEWEKTEDKGRTQTLWRTRGSPHVVLVPSSSAPPPLASIKLQIAALIQFCLKPQQSSQSQDSVPYLSSYRRGLLHVSSVLPSERGPQVADMVVMLQVLLWGPRVPLFNPRGSTTTTVHNWLTIKRALLVMKLAERALIQDQSALDWEDCMCLQYLSFTDSETVISVTGPLWHALSTD
ncbi:inactive tyrosine-protein kinase PEAK1 [Mugil cephalus]|uniref:inactive tyrosine-protein kinase PEAK1 n=1 Tax=Mugil cephalus TaxID=48193 RepID=UPI001FB78DBE|nr:inactive tyrosine-protein kinase PEAK1 [Mugil cephalus]